MNTFFLKNAILHTYCHQNCQNFEGRINDRKLNNANIVGQITNYFNGTNLSPM